MSTNNALTIWKTIKLGTHLKTNEDFNQAFQFSGVNDRSGVLTGPLALTFPIATEETVVDLVTYSVRELGFPGGATREQVYEKACQKGLGLCAAEVGPQLRLQYLDQPQYKGLIVGMEPIVNLFGILNVFSVTTGGVSSYLSCCCGNPEYRWDADNVFVFVQPRS